MQRLYAISLKPGEVTLTCSQLNSTVKHSTYHYPEAVPPHRIATSILSMEFGWSWNKCSKMAEYYTMDVLQPLWWRLSIIPQMVSSEGVRAWYDIQEAMHPERMEQVYAS